MDNTNDIPNEEQTSRLQQPVVGGSLPTDVRDFIYHVTLELQAHRSRSEAQKDALFQKAYRLYSKYDVEHGRQ